MATFDGNLLRALLRILLSEDIGDRKQSPRAKVAYFAFDAIMFWSDLSAKHAWRSF